LKLQRLNKAFHFKTLSGDNVFIGDPNEADFKPLFWLSRWTNECHIRLLIGRLTKNLMFDEANNCVIWDSDLFTVKAYPKEKEQKTVTINGRQFTYELSSLGGLEFEAILKKKPQTNIFNIPIETLNLKFYYQPPLTEEFNPEDCEVYTETYIKTRNGEEFFRPPEVVGSYAVYHATRTNTHRSKEDAEKYKTGKAFHIYRPKAIDSVGNETWCDLKVDEAKGVLTITIPQDFLDKAVYPVTIDPTFGYETVGASYSDANNKIMGSVFTISESGAAESITAYISETGTRTYRFGIYKHDDSSFIGETESTTPSATTSAKWHTLNFYDPKPSLTANTEYVLVVKVHKYGGRYFYYDSGETNQGHYQSISWTNGEPDWPNPASFTHNNNKYSIYCTYTAEAGATEIIVTDSATSQDIFNRPYREIPTLESTLGQELMLKTRNLSMVDVAACLEIIQKARQISTITDAAEGLEQVLKQRLISLLDQAASFENVARPARVTIVADEVLGQEILSKLRELAAVFDSTIGIEYVNTGLAGEAVKTRIFLFIGDLAIQITGD